MFLQHKNDQHSEIISKKIRFKLVMDGSQAQIGVDVSDMNLPVINYSTVRSLISCACWERFNWDISITFLNAKAEEETKHQIS